jgi:glycosyltransferase involved in cell wall biosynthesis
MAAGTPVLAPARGAFVELLVDGAEGTLFEPDSVAALAAAFHDVERFPERYRNYGRNARQGYEDRFNPDAATDQLLSIYDFAIRNPAWQS